MTRKFYFTAAPAIFDDAGADQLQGNGDIHRVLPSIYEPELTAPKNTGLLNAYGTAIFSVENREPVGFALSKAQ